MMYVAFEICPLKVICVVVERVIVDMVDDGISFFVGILAEGKGNKPVNEIAFSEDAHPIVA
jgi:hypothetical protein